MPKEGIIMKNRVIKKREMLDNKKFVAEAIATALQTMRFGEQTEFGDLQEVFWRSLHENDAQSMLWALNSMTEEVMECFEEDSWGEYSFPPRDLEWRIFKRIRHSYRELTVGEVKGLLPSWWLY